MQADRIEPEDQNEPTHLTQAMLEKLCAPPPSYLRAASGYTNAQPPLDHALPNHDQ